MDGHAEILAGRPQRIPPRVVEVLEALLHHAGLRQHDDAAMAFLDGASHFLRHGLDRAQVRNERERDIAIAVLAPLGQRVVVGLHAGELEFGVALEERRALHRIVGEQHLAVDAVVVEPFRRSPGRRRSSALRPALREGLAQGIAHHGGTVHGAALSHHLAVHEPALDRLVGGADHVLLVGRLAELGILSPHFAFDMRLVHVSLSNCACESQLMSP
jgi:hypothetical protein